MAVLQLISIAGALVVSQVDPEKKLSRLGGMFLFPAFSASLPISMSLIASNVAGYTKKATTSSIMFIGYCTGNIIGPFLFFSKEAPAYEVSFPSNNETVI